MSSAEDYVDGGSINWTGVAGGMVGTWILAYVVYVIDVIRMIGDALEWGITGLLGWITSLVGSLSGIPGAILTSAWGSAASFVAGLGVFGLPIAFVIAFASMWLLYTFLEVFLYE